MQMLFQWDMSHQEPRRLVENFWKSAKGDGQHTRICESIV